MKPGIADIILRRIDTFFTTWRFPFFMLMTLGLFWVLLMIMAFMPVPDSAWGAFAEDFKVWCFGYDPETGTMKNIYLLMFTVNPLILSLFILFVWYEPLKNLVSTPSIAKGYAATSVILVVSVGLSFLLMYDFPSEEDFVFQPEVLRISQTPPEFELINEHGKTVSLSDYHGKVILLTSIYASCSDTCPMILDQARRVLDNLTASEREEIVLIAVTMHPEKDTPELLSQIARFYNLDRYHSHLLTGEPEKVNKVLDYLSVARVANDGTGEIDHANLFFMIDREGKIAYRFTLGERQEQWMFEAAQTLIREEKPAKLTDVYGE